MTGDMRYATREIWTTSDPGEVVERLRQLRGAYEVLDETEEQPSLEAERDALERAVEELESTIASHAAAYVAEKQAEAR